MVVYDDVSKVFPGGVEALRNVSFDIDQGEFIFLTGPSGAGKSTLLRFLIRDDIPTDGVVFFQEEDIARLPNRKVPWLRRKIGMVFQDFKLLPRSTVFENIALTLEVTGRSTNDINELVPFMLEKVGLVEKIDAFPAELSAGESQRVAIARALIHEPDVLIADEPTGNLDVDTAWDVVDLIQQINEWGTTVIMATHDDRIVNKMRRRVIKLEEGTLVKDKIGKY